MIRSGCRGYNPARRHRLDSSDRTTRATGQPFSSAAAGRQPGAVPRLTLQPISATDLGNRSRQPISATQQRSHPSLAGRRPAEEDCYVARSHSVFRSHSVVRSQWPQRTRPSWPSERRRRLGDPCAHRGRGSSRGRELEHDFERADHRPLRRLSRLRPGRIQQLRLQPAQPHLVLADVRRRRVHQLRRVRRGHAFRRGDAALSARQRLSVARVCPRARRPGQQDAGGRLCRRLARRRVRHRAGRPRRCRRESRPASQLHRGIAAAPARSRQRLRVDAHQRRLLLSGLGAVAELLHPFPAAAPPPGPADHRPAPPAREETWARAEAAPCSPPPAEP